MKIIRQNIRAPRSDDSFGRGMDIALTVAVFFAIGLVLDRWLGTTPLFMIVLTVLAVVGFFLSLKYRYDAAMTQLEAERAAKASRSGARRT
jgi:F0F1-type ATP synthase assembly protein I